MKKELKSVGILLIAAVILAGFALAAYTPAEAAEPEEAIEETEIEITIPAAPAQYDVPLDDELLDHIIETTEEYDVDPALVLAVIGQESNFDAHTIGDNGRSLGLMQVQPRLNAERMDRLGVKDLLDARENVLVGIDLLADLLGQGSTAWALMAYNGGKSYADAMVARGEISEYAEEVLHLAESLKA